MEHNTHRKSHIRSSVHVEMFIAEKLIYPRCRLWLHPSLPFSQLFMACLSPTNSRIVYCQFVLAHFRCDKNLLLKMIRTLTDRIAKYTVQDQHEHTGNLTFSFHKFIRSLRIMLMPVDVWLMNTIETERERGRRR